MLVNYLSWLDYKKLMHVVRYYPTFNMYVIYRNYAKANSLDCFGGETSARKGYDLLIQHLKQRVGK
jgi:hypothetical protein